MFFEGSEKKAEIMVDINKINLLTDIDNTFWSDLVTYCNAQVLTTIENQYCKAFVLSESSLFVWPERFLIITCGETSLVNSIEFFLSRHSKSVIEHLIYQRKNEYFANAQPSCFGDDIKIISKFVKGKAYRFGELDRHHNYIFHQQNEYKADRNDKTFQFLAYQISLEASKHLTQNNLSRENIKAYLCLDTLLSDFIIDDYLFQPYGYSLNAINGKDYLTIHITPQASSSYISFESSINIMHIAPKIIEILQPASFDVLSFNEEDFEIQLDQFIPKKYIGNSLIKQTLDNNYLIHFANFIRPQQQFTSAIELDIDGENHTL